MHEHFLAGRNCERVLTGLWLSTCGFSACSTRWLWDHVFLKLALFLRKSGSKRRLGALVPVALTAVSGWTESIPIFTSPPPRAKNMAVSSAAMFCAESQEATLLPNSEFRYSKRSRGVMRSQLRKKKKKYDIRNKYDRNVAYEASKFHNFWRHK